MKLSVNLLISFVYQDRYIILASLKLSYKNSVFLYINNSSNIGEDSTWNFNYSNVINYKNLLEMKSVD